MTARTLNRIENTQSRPVTTLTRVVPVIARLPHRSGYGRMVQGTPYILDYPPPPAYLTVSTATAAAAAEASFIGVGPASLPVVAADAAAASAGDLTGGASILASQQTQTSTYAILPDTMSARAQSFELAADATLGSVAIKLAKSGLPLDTVTLEIQSNATNKPSGTTLETTTAVSGATITSSQAWYEFPLDAPLALSANTQYWIVVSRSGAFDATKYYHWGRAGEINASWLISSNFTDTGWAAGSNLVDMTFIAYTP